MSSFTNHPPLLPLLDGKRWRVMEDFEYHVGSEDSDEVVKIPKDFITDLASIPKIFWSIIGGPAGRYTYAAIVHDYAYFKNLYTRKRCDEIFLEAMTVLKVSWWKRRLMYRAVRIFAFQPWNRYRKQNNPT